MKENTARRMYDMGEMVLHTDDLAYFCRKIGELSGIALKASKQDLVKTRIRSRIAALGLGSYSEYRAYVSGLPEGHEEWQIFINLLTTNKTDFFREPKHFDFLIHRFLPEWLKKGERHLKIWSAACSTGEEAYTLAMILSKHLPPDRDFKILATDIDTEVIHHASNAVYPLARKTEIPVEYHRGAINIGSGDVQGWFRIIPKLKEKVVFKRHNLIEMSSPGSSVFDLIFCRNVFIYFAPQSIEQVAKKLYSSTKSGGYFFIGHSESLQNVSHDWKLVAPSTMVKE